VELKHGCYLVQYVRTLGIAEQWQFIDVWGFESDLLQLLPRPVCAVLLLYPLSDKVFLVSLSGVRYSVLHMSLINVCLCMTVSMFIIYFMWSMAVFGCI